MDKQQIVDSIIKDIKQLPGVDYLTEIASTGESNRWNKFLLDGDSKLVPRLLDRYQRNKQDTIKFLLGHSIRSANQDLLRIISSQILELLSKSKRLTQIVDNALIVDALLGPREALTPRQREMLYLSKFVLTGENPEPRKLYSLISTFIMDPKGLDNKVLIKFKQANRFWENNIERLLRELTGDKFNAIMKEMDELSPEEKRLYVLDILYKNINKIGEERLNVLANILGINTSAPAAPEPPKAISEYR